MDVILNMSNQDTIRNAIAKSGIRYNRLSKLIGVHPVTISRWCSDRPTPIRESNIYNVARALDKEVKWLNKSKTECELVEPSGVIEPEKKEELTAQYLDRELQKLTGLSYAELFEHYNRLVFENVKLKEGIGETVKRLVAEEMGKVK